MAIDGTARTGLAEAKPAAPQVCGAFHAGEAMEEAIMRRSGSIFDRSHIPVRVPGREDPRTYGSRETPVLEDDARLGNCLAVLGRQPAQRVHSAQ